MGAAFVQNPTLQGLYGLDGNKTFDEQFSHASIESAVLYDMAYAHYVLEKIFDTHKSEVENYIRQMKPHTLRWYVSKAKMFRAEQALIDGTDVYDDTDLTEEQIVDMQVVKFAAATESEATVYIKIAGGTDTAKQPISEDQKAGLEAYLKEIKDAGVRVEIINEPASRLKLNLHIYYNAMMLGADGAGLQSGSKPVEDTVKDYIQNLPFNGEYRNADLIDRLQAITGVVIPTLNSASESNDGGGTWQDIAIKSTPYAGYYKIYNTTDLKITYEAYEGVSD